jgi:hypothetical protein
MTRLDEYSLGYRQAELQRLQRQAEQLGGESALNKLSLLRWHWPVPAVRSLFTRWIGQPSCAIRPRRGGPPPSNCS